MSGSAPYWDPQSVSCCYKLLESCYCSEICRIIVLHFPNHHYGAFLFIKWEVPISFQKYLFGGVDEENTEIYLLLDTQELWILEKSLHTSGSHFVVPKIWCFMGYASHCIQEFPLTWAGHLCYTPLENLISDNGLLSCVVSGISSDCDVFTLHWCFREGRGTRTWPHWSAGSNGVVTVNR